MSPATLESINLFMVSNRLSRKERGAMKVAELWRYPVKSMAGERLEDGP
jgi:hypothetical protein